MTNPKGTTTQKVQPDPLLQVTLPIDFAPGDRDVVIGKGKKFYFHTGNQVRPLYDGIVLLPVMMTMNDDD